MDEPSVSIVTPILNMRRFLPDTVDSIYAQDFSNWELLLIDDGSTDGSAELAEEYAGRNPERVRVLRPLAEGASGSASAARNRGLRVARGRWIAFLDADDIWLPGKLSRQAAILAEHPEAGMTFARVRYFPDDPAQGAEWDQPFEPLREGVYAPPDLTREFLSNDNIYPCPTATLIRRDALLEVGGFEERFRKVRTDLAVWTKLTAHYPAYADPAIVARYRQHANSSVARLYADEAAHHQNEFAFWGWLMRYAAPLPARVRDALDDAACRRVYPLLVSEALAGGHSGKLAWRLAVLRRMREYPAYMRKARFLGYILPGAKS